MIGLTLVLLLALAIAPPAAHAYLDPGSGSMMVQLLLAGFAGAAVAVKLFWRRITALFTAPKDKKS